MLGEGAGRRWIPQCEPLFSFPSSSCVCVPKARAGSKTRESAKWRRWSWKSTCGTPAEMGMVKTSALPSLKEITLCNESDEVMAEFGVLCMHSGRGRTGMAAHPWLRPSRRQIRRWQAAVSQSLERISATDHVERKAGACCFTL
jgi:hypothetical protein